MKYPRRSQADCSQVGRYILLNMAHKCWRTESRSMFYMTRQEILWHGVAVIILALISRAFAAWILRQPMRTKVPHHSNGSVLLRITEVVGRRACATYATLLYQTGF